MCEGCSAGAPRDERLDARGANVPPAGRCSHPRGRTCAYGVSTWAQRTFGKGLAFRIADVAPDRVPQCRPPEGQPPQCERQHSGERFETGWKFRNVRSAQERRAHGGTAGVGPPHILFAELCFCGHLGFPHVRMPGARTAVLCRGQLRIANRTPAAGLLQSKRLPAVPTFPKKSRPDSSRRPRFRSPPP